MQKPFTYKDTYLDDIQDTIFADIPTVLVVDHGRYKNITRNYIAPNLLLSSHFEKKQPIYQFLPDDQKTKIPIEKRNRRILDLGLSTDWKTFISLTFAPEFYPASDGWEDYEYLQNEVRKFTRALKYRYPDMKYLGVLEHGRLKGRKHFHLLTTVPFESSLFVHYHKQNAKICPLWTNGFSDVQKVLNEPHNAVFYLLAYVKKNQPYRTPIGKREVFASKGLAPVTRRIVNRLELGKILEGYKLVLTNNKTQIYFKDDPELEKLIKKVNSGYYSDRYGI